MQPTFPVLLVSYFFPPTNTAGIYRILGFTKYLPESGIRPVLLTASPVPGREYTDPGLIEKVPKDLVIHRARAWCLGLPTGDGILQKIWRGTVEWFERFMPLDPYFLFGIAGASAARRLIRKHRCRAIVTSSPPHSIHISGYIQKKCFGTPWIADFRDPATVKTYSGLDASLGANNSFLSERMEKLVVENADVVIANTPTNRSILESRYPSSKGRFIVISNGFDPDDIDLSSETAKPKGIKGRKLLVAYTGEIYEGLGDPLWEGLIELKREDPSISMKLEIRIAGIISPADLSRIESAGLTDVVKHIGFVSASDSLKLLAESDVALFLLPKEGFAFWVPSKLYNYIGFRKYVLALIPEGDASRIIEEVNAGTCVQPIPEKISEAFTRLLELREREGVRCDYNLEALKRYSRPYQATQLAAAIRRIQPCDP